MDGQREKEISTFSIGRDRPTRLKSKFKRRLDDNDSRRRWKVRCQTSTRTQRGANKLQRRFGRNPLVARSVVQWREKISKEFKVDMAEVGKTADLLEIKIKECQLGLFGWGDKPGHGKDIRATDSVPVEIKSAVEKAAVNGTVTCAAALEDRRSAQRKAKSGLCRLRDLKTQDPTVSARRLLILRMKERA